MLPSMGIFCIIHTLSPFRCYFPPLYTPGMGSAAWKIYICPPTHPYILYKSLHSKFKKLCPITRIIFLLLVDVFVNRTLYHCMGNPHQDLYSYINVWVARYVKLDINCTPYRRWGQEWVSVFVMKSSFCTWFFSCLTKIECICIWRILICLNTRTYKAVFNTGRISHCKRPNSEYTDFKTPNMCFIPSHKKSQARGDDFKYF